MKCSEIRGYEDNYFDVKFADNTRKWEPKQTYEFNVQRNTLYIHNHNEGGLYPVDILNTTSNALSILTEERERVLLRLDKVEEKNNTGTFNILQFNNNENLDLKIVIDDAILTDLRQIHIPYEKAIRFFNREFIYMESSHSAAIFTYGNNNNDKELCLVGIKYICTVRKSEQGYLHVTSISPNQNISGIINIIRGDIQFIDNSKTNKRVDSETERRFQEAAKNNKELLTLWSLYDKLDMEAIRQEIREMGCLKYRNYTRTGNLLVFHLDNDFTSKNFARENIQYAAISSEFYNPDSINDDDYRNALAIGSEIDQSCINTGRFIIQDDITDPTRSIPSSGYIIPSFTGSSIQSHRREKAQKRILNCENPLPRLKYLLETGCFAGTTGNERKAITNDLQKEIFGNSSMTFNDRQKEAIRIALNTPDVALIQGPPGTGKTKVIKAIVRRINDIEKGEAKILISSTQHDAVDNAINDIDYSGVPVNRVMNRMRKQNEDYQIYQWIDNIIDSCDNWLTSNEPTDENKAIYEVLEELEGCEEERISSHIETLKTLLLEKGYSELTVMVSQKEMEIMEQINTSRKSNVNILEIVDRISTDKKDFFPNGPRDLKTLNNAIHDTLGNVIIPTYWYRLKNAKANMQNLEPYLELLRKDLEEIKQKLKPEDIDEENNTSDYRHEIYNLITEIEKGLVKKKSIDAKSRLYDSVWQFKHELSNTLNVKNLISAYSKINAATCQQAASRTINIAMQGFDEIYDYVIIDEAARSNPLDLLIPMSMGRKVILVGDHKQLPHMVEKDIVDAVVSRSGNNEAKTILQESLFMRLFMKLKKFDRENMNSDSGIRIQRTCTLNEQFRMHPAICDLINVFYKEENLKSGCTAEDRKNNISRYACKPIVWLDVPLSEQHPGENNSNGANKFSKCRQTEIDIIKNELPEILKCNDEYSIGIITFYSKQAILLEEMVNEEYPNDMHRISVGTVDSFQGKEFDIVILSTVRSNREKDKRRRVGFLDNDNRLCVAFSRAKRMLIAVGDSKTIANDNGEVIIEPLNELLGRSKDNETGYYKIV